MGFPERAKEQALVACGRSCSLCHAFCGIKIELHHIVHVAEGGEDSFENCIPLCFNCHADMRSYDSKHPKGTKYTARELQKHRDNWHMRVKDELAATKSALSAERDQVEAEPHVQTEHGLLDYQVALDETFEQLAGIIKEYDYRSAKLTEHVGSLLNRITSTTAQSGPLSARQRCDIVVEGAIELSDYALHLKSANEAYAVKLTTVNDALEAVVKTHGVASERERAALGSLLATLDLICNNASGALASVKAMSRNLRKSPRPERNYIQSIEASLRELERFINNIEQTLSIISRARELGAFKLTDGEPGVVAEGSRLHFCPVRQRSKHV